MIRTSEINYFKSKLTNACGDTKKAWSVINSIRCMKKSTKFPSFIDVNGTIITSRRSICSEFHNYFVNVADKLNKSEYTTIQPHDFKQFLKNPSSSSIFLSPIISLEIIDIINKLDNRKSNDISPKHLKALSTSFSNALSYLFNSCMLSGVFPDELKIAKITSHKGLVSHKLQHLRSRSKEIRRHFTRGVRFLLTTFKMCFSTRELIRYQNYLIKHIIKNSYFAYIIIYI